MSEIASSIRASHKLTDIFGFWPTFHDAEIIDLHFWRGKVAPDQRQYVFPVLTGQFHVWELTDQVDEQGGLITRHHTLATMRFDDVEAFRMEGFNHQNEIFELVIERKERPDGPSPLFSVEFKRASTFTASFRCFGIEVVEASPCAKEGLPTGTSAPTGS